MRNMYEKYALNKKLGGRSGIFRIFHQVDDKKLRSKVGNHHNTIEFQIWECMGQLKSTGD